MSRPQLGVWLVGARGNVATTACVGLAALQRGLAPTTGLVTELPLFAETELAAWPDLVVGGHDIRRESLRQRATALAAERVVPQHLVDAVADDLDAIERRIRPGTLWGCGPRVSDLAEPGGVAPAASTARQAIDALRRDLIEFRERSNLDRVVVVYLASTEPPIDLAQVPTAWRDLERELTSPTPGVLRASSLYAIAAIESGASFVNFTPSLGATCPAIEELAREKKIPLAGQDGKTGETLLKTVLAPLFAQRHLQVLSWVGHNIFGNLDGRVLDDPTNKASKIHSKDASIASVLGYAPQTHVSIEYIQSLGDWKTAWDHVHFQGFLATPMTLQFTWQGCDSALAAPLVLDLVRLIDAAQRQGLRGPLTHLASFFKSPIGTSEHDFARQFEMLAAWAREAADRTSRGA